MKTLLRIPLTLAVAALALPGCASDPEPEPHESEICFCETPPPRDAGSLPDAETADSGCVAPEERTCIIV